MLFRRRNIDGEDARQGDGHETNLRVLIASTIIVVLALAALYFGFGFGNKNFSTSGPVNPEVAAPPPANK